MDVFLPIAQVFVNPIEILLLSAIVGVLSGLFGVGGGFLMTPFLIFLGTSIHETSQVAAAALIYDQQFNNPETLDVATVTKLIRNTFLVVLIPLFAFLYNRGEVKDQKYSVLKIFPYFVVGFIGMIIIRNLGDQFFTIENNNFYIWSKFIEYLKILATVFLTMAMAAVGISINLSELKSMGHKPFVVGLIAAVTVGIISIIYIETIKNFMI